MAERFPNILTVDVEDWFHILEVEGGYTRHDWARLEPRVVANTERLLDLFEGAGCRATFFIVGWVAERQPDLVKRIAERGHEIASHSYWHEVLHRHDRASLAADVRRVRELLEDLSGQPVAGFRAPGGSVTPATAWAFETLLESGYRYDSSMCPGYSSHGGFPGAHFGPHIVRCAAGEITEVPMSTVGFGRYRLPYAGGGFLRILPTPALRAATAFENSLGRPCVIYVHPREIDPEQPRMELSRLRAFKYYVGLRSTEGKLRALTKHFRFLPVREWLDEREESLRSTRFDVRPHAEALPPNPDPARIPPPPPLATPSGV